MPRLFWKFFITIWLTLAIVVTVIIFTVKSLATAPFEPELQRQKRELTLSFAAYILAHEGEGRARFFLQASQSVSPVGLEIVQVADERACKTEPPPNATYVPKGDICYRISVVQQANFIVDNLSVVMPWFAIMLASMIAAAALARYLIRPVVHLRDGLSALAHGRFDTRIGDRMAGRRDEVTALAHDFDATAARLEELQGAQQRLFHDVSHELRSPLSRLQAAAGILRQNPGRINDMLDRLDRETERLDALVGEVLTLARLNASSQMPLKTQTLDLIELLNEILDDASFEAQSRDVTITTGIEGSFLAEVEGELIYRAFENVVRNASKYTAEGTHILVSCEVKGDVLTVQVSDDGPGVRPEELERIFQPFSRGTDVIEGGGYGLGLAITRRSVERHGGRAFACLPDRGGLVITLAIPRRPPARP